MSHTKHSRFNELIDQVTKSTSEIKKTVLNSFQFQRNHDYPTSFLQFDQLWNEWDEFTNEILNRKNTRMRYKSYAEFKYFTELASARVSSNLNLQKDSSELLLPYVVFLERSWNGLSRSLYRLRKENIHVWNKDWILLLELIEQSDRDLRQLLNLPTEFYENNDSIIAELNSNFLHSCLLNGQKRHLHQDYSPRFTINFLSNLFNLENIN